MPDMRRWMAAGLMAALAACGGGDHEYDPDNDAEVARTTSAPAQPRPPAAAQPPGPPASAATVTPVRPDSVRAAFGRGRPLGASEIGWLRRDVNRTQVATAQALGVRAYADAQIQQLVRQGRLVALGDSTPYWVLRKMDHSVPYVTPDARALLLQVGRRFHARLDSLGIPRYRMKVTSALRTGSTQAELRKINSYASQTASAHEFGTTMDVSHERFAVPAGAAAQSDTLEELGKEHAKVLQGELGRTLIELRTRELLHVMIEDRQPVYHFTVRQRLAGR
ncbi:MAG TPA: DUF5715 family protein [Longimicrobium sp.]|nr:DUF5715 family protein [Longimicrobium sp.]